jgi:hypothetical protein
MCIKKSANPDFFQLRVSRQVKRLGLPSTTASLMPVADRRRCGTGGWLRAFAHTDSLVVAIDQELGWHTHYIFLVDGLMVQAISLVTLPRPIVGAFSAKQGRPIADQVKAKQDDRRECRSKVTAARPRSSLLVTFHLLGSGSDSWQLLLKMKGRLQFLLDGVEAPPSKRSPGAPLCERLVGSLRDKETGEKLHVPRPPT